MLKAGLCLYIVAWNNGIGVRFYFVGFRFELMINRDICGHTYVRARGEIR